jgi:hypothetical protein
LAKTCFSELGPENSLSGTSVEIDGLAFKRFKRKREGEYERERENEERGRKGQREREEIWIERMSG